MSDYPNLRALVAQDNSLEGRALLAALDYSEAVEAAHDHMSKAIPRGKTQALAWDLIKDGLYRKAGKTAVELAALEAEAQPSQNTSSPPHDPGGP